MLIHGQFLREDQLDSYKALGIMPSLFPMHTFYWRDSHLDHTVGAQAGMNISPTARRSSAHDLLQPSRRTVDECQRGRTETGPRRRHRRATPNRRRH